MTAEKLLPLPSHLPPGPPYGVRTLAEVLPSVAAGLRVAGYADLLGFGDADRVVVLLVDGLGLHALLDHPEQAPFLHAPAASSGADARLSAAFPTTTPTGLASLGTGLPPGGHGLVGASFRVPETGRTLWPLKWKGDPHPVATQPEPTVFERAAAAGVAVSVVAPRDYERSGLTRAVLRGGRYTGADEIGERVAEVAAAVRLGDRSLVYAYWPGLDRVGHQHGVDSPHWRAELAYVDAFAQRLVADLPADAVLHVTADHGMVDCPREHKINLDEVPELWAQVRLVAGEPRARHVYVAPGTAADVAQTWRRHLGAAAIVVTREQAITAGWFGPVEPEYAERIGDVLAVATTDAALTSSRIDSRVSALRGQHGGLTPAEVDIPLLQLRNGALDGRAVPEVGHG